MKITALLNWFFRFSWRKGQSHNRNPYRDWTIMVIAFFTLLVFVLVFSTFFYMRIDRGKIFRNVAGVTTDLSTLDRSLLHTTADYYRERGQKLELLKTSKAPEIDPAL